MTHEQIKTEIALLREWKTKARSIPAEKTFRLTREEWQPDEANSSFSRSGKYVQIEYSACSRLTIIEYVKMEVEPRSISYIISMNDETPTGGHLNFSAILESVDRKIEVLQEEIELTGKIRVSFFNDSYMFCDSKFVEVFSAHDFFKLRSTVSHNLFVMKNNSNADGVFWASFSKLQTGSNQYEESLTLFRQRIKL